MSRSRHTEAQMIGALKRDEQPGLVVFSRERKRARVKVASI
jgi:hypothetical protein